MTIAELTTNFTLMREENTDIFSELTDLELQALKRPTAEEILNVDLLNSINDTTQLESIITKYETLLNLAITYKQLELFYKQSDDSEGSLTHSRYRNYQQSYDDIKKRFTKYNVRTDNKFNTRVTGVFYG